eukprot:GHVP01035727.1.p1 GENE.GHVP01035727.1~~GHVP01035727.1.p1  ORF type:complete len:230 (-),score=33.30 GHVP01035727.1:1024-1713(-)
MIHPSISLSVDKDIVDKEINVEILMDKDFNNPTFHYLRNYKDCDMRCSEVSQMLDFLNKFRMNTKFARKNAIRVMGPKACIPYRITHIKDDIAFDMKNSNGPLYYKSEFEYKKLCESLLKVFSKKDLTCCFWKEREQKVLSILEKCKIANKSGKFENGFLELDSYKFFKFEDLFFVLEGNKCYLLLEKDEADFRNCGVRLPTESLETFLYGDSTAKSEYSRLSGADWTD